MNFTTKLTVFILLFSSQLQAQLKYKFDYYSTENGLSHDAVTNITKDREGFIWIGTWNGINRFDGHKFKSYKSFPGDLSQLKNDRIDQILEDHSTSLWIKAYDSQIYRFDKRREQFHPFLAKEAKHGNKIIFDRVQVSRDGTVWLLTFKNGLFIVPDADNQKQYIHITASSSTGLHLPSDSVRFVYEDLSGKIWVSTAKGMICIEKKSKGSYRALTLNNAIFQKEKFMTKAEDADNLYFGTDQGYLVVYSKAAKTATRRRITNSAIHMLLASKKQKLCYATSHGGELIVIKDQGNDISKHTYINGQKLLSIYEDRLGDLWIEPEKRGVVRFSPATEKFTQLLKANDEGSSYVGNHYKVFEDKKGRVWVNMKGGGFGYYDAGKSKIEGFYDTPGLVDQRFSSIVTSLFYDDGVLWFSTPDRGINKIILQDNDFTQQLLTTLPHHKSDNEVRGIWADGKRRLWVGTRSGSLFIFKEGKNTPVTFTNSQLTGLGPIYCLLEDRNGNIWIGTKSNGLYKAIPVDPNHSSYKLIHFSKGNTAVDINSNEVYALLEDKFGKIWIGTFDEGLNIATMQNGSVKFSHTSNGLKGYPREGFRKIRNMSLDKDGNVWIGTTNGLVVKQVGNASEPGKNYAVYSKVPGLKQSLGNNDIQFIFRDSRNIMWLATSGGGLDKAVGRNPFQNLTFRNYTTRDGLPSDYVLSGAEDNEGYIWAATQNGLSRFDAKKEEFKNYDSYDGLPKATFSEASSQKFPDGTLVFGTNRGYLSFHPAYLKNYHTQANMVFTNLQINNEDQFPSPDGLLQFNINYTNALRLNYDQNIISIDYTVLDPKLGPKQIYAYRLNGFETSWNTNNEQRSATYTNLPPGKYTFEVKSLTKELYQKMPYRKFDITILPPPWKTWWAYLIYFTILIVVLEIVRRTAMTMIKLRNKILVEQKLAELKSNFFTNISHELRTPLTLILNPIEEIRRNERLSAEGISQIEIVRKNSNRMIRFINQLLDLRKLESGKATLKITKFDLLIFLKNIFGYFNELALKKNIILELLCEDREVVIWADAEKLDIVIYNLLSNAFKYSPHNKTIKIIVTANLQTNEVGVEVCDQGQGVEEEKLEEIFGLYYQANEHSDTQQKGTGIGLALAKELIELHEGTISAKRNQDEGLTVEVCLPIGITYADAVTIDSTEPVASDHFDKAYSPPVLNYTDEQKEAKNSTVLLVEDNTDLRNFLCIQLSRIYNVETASDGQEGWEKAKILMPDLILSDVMMPRMSGIELLDHLKNEISTSHIPVILLSAKHAIEHQIEGLRYGADYYITKPFNNEFLFAAIAGLIKRRKTLFDALIDKKEHEIIEPSPVVITQKDKLFLEKVIEIVEHNMENSEFNIDSVAETIGMGRSTFYRKFKSLTDLAPVEFVRDMRLQRAKQYLDAGEKSIAVIAYTVGFNNAKYFSTCFKERYQVSPTEYLRSKAAK